MDEQEEKHIAVAIGKLETKMEFMSDSIKDLSKKLDEMSDNYQEIGGIMKGYADLQTLINQNTLDIKQLNMVKLTKKEYNYIKALMVLVPIITFFLTFLFQKYAG